MEKKEGLNWSLFIPILISVAALGLSGYQFYISSIQEVHSFWWVWGGNGVYIANAGNRTEVMTYALISYTDGNGQQFYNVSPTEAPGIVKPGDIRFIQMSPLDPLKIKAAFPNGDYKTEIALKILDTRSSDRSKSNAVLFTGGYASPVAYHDLYAPAPAGVILPP